MVDASQCWAHSRRLTHSRHLAHFISFPAAPYRFSELDKGREGCSGLSPLQAWGEAFRHPSVLSLRAEDGP